MTLDELVIKLTLDPRGLSEGTKTAVDSIKKFQDAAKKEADDVEHQTGRMVQGFSQVTKELLGLGAVLLGIGGIKEMVTKTVGEAAGTGRAGAIFGLDPEMLNKWQGAMEHFGVSAETTAGAIGEVATSIARLKHFGQGDLLKGSIMLQMLGITNPSDDPFKLLTQTTAAIQKHPEIVKEPGFLRAMMQEFPAMAPLQIGLQSSQLQQFLATSQTATKGQIDAAIQLSQAATDLKQAAERISNRIMESSAPAATAIEKTAAFIDSGVKPGAAATHLSKSMTGWRSSCRINRGAVVDIDRTVLGWLGVHKDTFNDKYGDLPERTNLNATRR